MLLFSSILLLIISQQQFLPSTLQIFTTRKLQNHKFDKFEKSTEPAVESSSSFSTFHRLSQSQTPLIEELLKQRTKWNFSRAKFSTRKEHSEKPITLGIVTFDYAFNKFRDIVVIRFRHDKKYGNKWIHLSNRIPYYNYDLPTIAIKDTYLFIRAMDSLMSRLGEHENNHPICKESINGSLFHDYGLKISPNKKNGTLQFVMVTIEKKSQKKVLLFFPIRLLPFMRDGMTKILKEFDGTQQIKPPPSPLPKWISENSENVNKLQEAILYRDTLDYKVNDKPKDRKIQIGYIRGARGIKYIEIAQAFDKRRTDIGNVKNPYFDFAKIPIQDAQPLLNAMEIISIGLQKKPPINQNQSSMKFVQGLWYDYKIEINSCPNGQLDFVLQTLINTEKYHLHVPKKLYGQVPIRVFHWLREQMNEILLVSSASLGQIIDINHEKQGAELTSNLEFNYREKEILHFEKLPYINYNEGKRNTMFVFIEMQQSKNERKSINLYQWLHFTAHKFVRIFISAEAYSIVKAMDELMSKLTDIEKPPNSPLFVRDREGLIYNYKVGIRPNKYGHLEFIMESITIAKNSTHEPKRLIVPVRLLPLVREEMAKMLKEFDRTEEIGPTLSSLPKWMEEEEMNPNDMINVNVKEANKEKWEILRQEQFGFNVFVNTIIGKQDRKMIIRLQRNKWGRRFHSNCSGIRQTIEIIEYWRRRRQKSFHLFSTYSSGNSFSLAQGNAYVVQ